VEGLEEKKEEKFIVTLMNLKKYQLFEQLSSQL